MPDLRGWRENHMSVVTCRVPFMPLRERCCDVCAARADLTKTSANFGRVHFFCTEHGKAFHVLAFCWVAGSTREVFARIDLWINMKRETSFAQAR